MNILKQSVLIKSSLTYKWKSTAVCLKKKVIFTNLKGHVMKILWSKSVKTLEFHVRFARVSG